MRLRRLDLIRYGKFADATLDFGPAPEGPDVTIVYGPNEAGKSTAHAAWLDFLFGLPARDHPHAFRFERKDLMVGAVIETPDQQLTLRRTGSTKDPLTDAADRRVEEHRLASLLHGLDRAAYRTRFSLNDQILREGGADIATAQGDLGRLLHAGTSGLSGVTAELDAIEAQIDTFHKKGRSASTLARTRKAIADIEARMAEARLDPRTFDHLRDAVQEATAAVATARTAREVATRASALRQAADRTRALTRQIADLDARLADDPPGPDLPPAAQATVASADGARSGALAALDQARQRAATAQAVLEATPVDPAGPLIAARLATLDAATFDDGDPLLPRVLTATTDLGKRHEARRDLMTQMDALALRIAGPNQTTADVCLPQALLTRLRDLAQAVQDADRRVADLTAAAAGDGQDAALDPLPAGAADLRAALVVHDALTDDPATLRQTQDQAEAALATAVLGLPQDWHDHLANGLPEDATLTALGAALERVQQTEAAALRTLRDAQDELADLQAVDAAEAQTGEIVRDADIAAARDARDTLWLTHRTSLTAESADSFATAMRQDDDLRVRHAMRADARLRLVQRQVGLAQAGDRVRRRQDDLAAANRAAQVQIAAGTACATTLGLPPEADVATLRSRRAALLHAGQARLDAHAAAAATETAAARRATAVAAVAAALSALNVQPPQGRILPVARATAAAFDEQAQALRDRVVASDALRQLSRNLETAERHAARTVADLRAAIAPLWCRDLSAADLLDRLDDLTALAGLALRREELDQRIGRMTAALDSFQALTPDLLELLDLPDGTDAATVLATARTRADDTAATSRTVAAAQEALTAAQADQAVQCGILERVAATFAEVLAGQDVAADLPPLQAVEVLLSRDARRADRSRALAERDRAAEGCDPAALAQEAALDDPLRTQTLALACEEAEAALEAAIDRRGSADAALRLALQKTGAAVLDQERATALETLRDDARREAAHLLGLMAARGALRRFRQDRRGEMLQATEHAFATMTGGEWPRLDTQPMGKTERLVGIRNGEAVPADAMSTGTRGQLYLALRIAGHADFIARNGPLPFVTDDIHETFDDDRARAAIALSGDMGRRGQVILFTHHRHLIDLARAALPQVHVIDMPQA